ncbi:MAG: metal-binding protein [Cyanothece sp. SIO2G6]|nr:metal-binding protein [Cyanothece sp. SIO2G6]
MPAGRIHDRITLWGLPVIVTATLSRTGSTEITLAVATGFLLGGLLLGPDLDTRSIHYKRWGWLRWIWWPYRHYIRHRSPLSHGPLLGTTVRVCYLLGWLLMLGCVGVALANELLQLGWTWNQMGDRLHALITHHWLAWVALAIGLELGAISHILADWSLSTYKRIRKYGWKGKKQQKRKHKR